MTQKWNLPLTYEPKIAGVCDGTIRQTIRVGRKFSPGDLVSFHGWSGRPYRSPWSFRTPYAALKAVIPITILTDGIEAPREFRSWSLLDGIARLNARCDRIEAALAASGRPVAPESKQTVLLTDFEGFKGESSD